MYLEKLYQDVWAQVFAGMWVSASNGSVDAHLLTTTATTHANVAAEAALAAWNPAKAHAAICDAQGLTPIQAAAAQEGE